MKKMIVAIVTSLLLSGAVYANQLLTLEKSTATFVPMQWQSSDTTDCVRITNASGEERQVIVYVDMTSESSAYVEMGSDINGCHGPATRYNEIKAGSSEIRTIDGGETLFIGSYLKGTHSKGTYEINIPKAIK